MFVRPRTNEKNRKLECNERIAKETNTHILSFVVVVLLSMHTRYFPPLPLLSLRTHNTSERLPPPK